MRDIHIPIRGLMPEPADDVDFMPMPREMSTFEMPSLPEAGPDTDLAGARDVLAHFLPLFGQWLAEGGEPPRMELAAIAPAALKVLNETLGEGEVSVIVRGDQEIRIQETVFSGVWREQCIDATGALLHDQLLAAPIPPVVPLAAAATGSPLLRLLELPPGAMNVPALVNEVQEAMNRSGPDTPSHVINLTLLPLSPDDVAHLDRTLEDGSVVILSRGFGNCRISSTAARHVWRVQYFNNMQTLILNTIEIVPVPEVALAAREDLVETHERLADLLLWMEGQAAAPRVTA